VRRETDERYQQTVEGLKERILVLRAFPHIFIRQFLEQLNDCNGNVGVFVCFGALEGRKPGR
jgi:hypothetical protein